MTERDVIVRCPGCGNGKVVALAVGQLLQCDICRTAFQAPVAADAPPDTNAPLDSVDHVRKVEPGGTPGNAPPARGTPSPKSASSSSGSGSSVSRTGSWQKGSWRTGSWQKGELDVPPAVDAVPVQPVSTAVDLPEPPAKSDNREPFGMLWTIVTMFAVGVIMTLVVVAGYFVVHALPNTHRDRWVQGGRDGQNNVVLHWTDASKFSQRKAPITVKVERVKYGALRVKDLANQVITTADDNLLGITVSAHNRGKRPREFVNWYGHVFEGDQGEASIAELTDDQDRHYSLLKFDDVSHVEGRRLADEIGPQQAVQDTLVFLIPEETDRSTIKYFRLTLPGAAVGVSGFFRFQIPPRMIENFAESVADEPGP